MIIQGKTTLPVGERVDGIQILINGAYQPAQPFVVVRAATESDYWAYVAETDTLDQITDPANIWPYFYEITTD